MSDARSPLTSFGVVALAIALAGSIAGCGGGGTSETSSSAAVAPRLPTTLLKAADVKAIISQGATRAIADGSAVTITVVDHEGHVLGVFAMAGAPEHSPDGDTPGSPVNEDDMALGATAQNIALQKAGTAAFLSSDQNAFSTTTGAYIVQDHFPPGVKNMAQGPLFQLTMSQLPCSDVRPANGVTGRPGGIPIYIDGVVAGGIGVDGAAAGGNAFEEDEVIALAGGGGIYAAPPSITANNIFLGGIQLPYANTAQPPALTPIPFDKLAGTVVFEPIDAAPTTYPNKIYAGVEGELRYPIKDGDAVTAPDGTQVNLTQHDVNTIITNSVALAVRTRAAIREPVGVPARMHVGVTDIDGNIIGEFRMSDATGFSFDIVIQKGRTVTAFSDPHQFLGQMVRGYLGVDLSEPIAFTTRSIEFIAQPFYPPGINANGPGPLNNIQLQLYDPDDPIPTPTPSCAPYSPGNGVCLFPGSAPLYKDGALVGGLGLSGDGVDQDDFITAGGAQGFEPPAGITADHISFRGTPLPYLKFPRHPLL